MCRVVRHDLTATTTPVGDSRQLVGEALTRWELPSLATDARLMVSELVTNALLHAGGPVAVSLAVADGTLEVGVDDHSPRLPDRSTFDMTSGWPSDLHAEGGRGLRLVDLIADEWGVAPQPEGKQVWFRLSVDTSWPHLTDCPCAGEDLERVRLQSGRFAVAAPGPWDMH